MVNVCFDPFIVAWEVLKNGFRYFGLLVSDVDAKAGELGPPHEEFQSKNFLERKAVKPRDTHCRGQNVSF